MPTGCTNIIEEGNPTLKDYLLRCARAFGAAAHLREERLDAPLRPREIDTYHERELANAKKVLADFLATPAKQTLQACHDANDAALAYWKERDAERRLLVTKYDSMREKVAAWDPPTPDHGGLKDFALSQIDLCVKELREPCQAPGFLSVEEYCDKRISSIQWRIDYHTKEMKNEEKRIKSANAWVSDLVGSL